MNTLISIFARRVIHTHRVNGTMIHFKYSNGDSAAYSIKHRPRALRNY